MPGRTVPARATRGVVGADEVLAALVERTAREVRAIYIRKGLEAAVAVGRHVLDRFYGGDLGAWRSVGKQHVSVAALARREDLGMSRNTLWSCLRVLEQLEELPAEVGERLSLSHHQSLFALPDPAARRAWAERSVAATWSSKVLRKKVTAYRRRNAPAEDRPSSRAPGLWVRELNRLGDAIGSLEENAGLAVGLVERRREHAADMARGFAARLVVLADRLEAGAEEGAEGRRR